MPHNDDLFYEEISYHGLDISRIEIGSDCSLGYMRNDFSYDTNHRVTRMLNTFFNPDPIAGRYNTSYEYDKAGNITKLNRYGLIDANAGQYTYGLIDSLVYTYANGDSRLSGIEDFVADPLAELKGFKIAGAFGYDGNGNFTSDGDQGLAIASNLINLPRIVASPSDSLLFEYTFGGEKIRKLQTSPVARDRIYLGGAEFVNDTLELYHHAEGRVVISGVKPAFQYRIADHLGNTVVFFEDRDGDAKIKTESMTSDPDSLEVLQRNYYYPFGMEMEGPWQAATAPRADYLYNGKELEEDLKLNWYAYGFRYYDPSIGRFTGVDPLAAQMPAWSPYSYTFDNPIRFIDPDGRAPDDDYYDQNGNFLYRDNQVSDNIKIISSSDWASIKSAYSSQLGDKSQSHLGLMQALDAKSTIVSDANISAEAWSNITTSILSSMDDIDVSKLYNGKVSVLNYSASGADAKFNDPTNFGSVANVDPQTLRETGDIKLTVYLWSGAADSELRTVSNVKNALGAHEYLGHGVKKYSDKTNTHHKAYELQMKHPSWQGTTPDFKQYQIEKYNEYKSREKR